MKIYDEITKKEITSDIDTNKGYTYDSRIVIDHVDDTYEIMEDSVSEDWPDGMRRRVPGYDVYEDCLYYHAYTEEELKQIKADKAQKEKEKSEAAAKAQEAAKIQAEKEKAERDRDEKIARIDSIDAQATYTAMMTDTLMSEEES